MEDLKQKVLTISKIEGISKRDSKEILGYNLIETVSTDWGDKDMKYTLWKTKKDGTNTKAYDQYKELGIEIGGTADISYKEEPREFQYKDKKTGEEKTGKTSNRTIAFFNQERLGVVTDADVVPPIEKYPF